MPTIFVSVGDTGQRASKQGRTMTGNVLDEFLAEDESSPGYTDEQAEAIYQAIKPYLKPDADWDNRFRPD